jgi:hypothetical protein
VKDSRSGQRAKILDLLISARGDWVSLPRIMACAAQYNARIHELPRGGFRIENRTKKVHGVRQSWFRLVRGPDQSAPDSQPDRIAKARNWLSVARGENIPADATGSLFGDLSLDRSYTE